MFKFLVTTCKYMGNFTSSQEATPNSDTKSLSTEEDKGILGLYQVSSSNLVNRKTTSWQMSRAK